jgi:predicted phosphodiesterase
VSNAKGNLRDKVVVVADLHLEKRAVKLVIDGEVRTVRKRLMVDRMLDHVKGARVVILNGDTVDPEWLPENWNGRGKPPGQVEMAWLVETLGKKGMREKTKVIAGNHDHNLREYGVLGEMTLRSYCLVPTGKTFTLIIHGHQGSYVTIVRNRTKKLPEGKKHAVPEDLWKYKQSLKSGYSPIPPVKEGWWLVCGHYDMSCWKENWKVMGLPKMEGTLVPGRNGWHLRYGVIDLAKESVKLKWFPDSVYMDV